MRTDVVEAAAHRLAAAGPELGDGWEAGRGGIENGALPYGALSPTLYPLGNVVIANRPDIQ